ncbi:hypothetical protein VN23_04520 [Janthinobacterium sp. B9-8]|nr:hypothetical protein VN23_04520 [Janthinobacterium sp. B9-8]
MLPHSKHSAKQNESTLSFDESKRLESPPLDLLVLMNNEKIWDLQIKLQFLRFYYQVSVRSTA